MADEVTKNVEVSLIDYKMCFDFVLRENLVDVAVGVVG
jgi:hypothetical protein